jgi:hypothetical protein
MRCVKLYACLSVSFCNQRRRDISTIFFCLICSSYSNVTSRSQVRFMLKFVMKNNRDFIEVLHLYLLIIKKIKDKMRRNLRYLQYI